MRIFKIINIIVGVLFFLLLAIGSTDTDSGETTSTLSTQENKEFNDNIEKTDSIITTTTSNEPEQTEIPQETESKLKVATITLVDAKMIRNNSVGNEWSYSVQVNEKTINLGDIIEISGEEIIAKATVKESDNIPDIGTGNLNLIEGENTLKVNVVENRGRYSGNTAEWIFTFNVNFK